MKLTNYCNRKLLKGIKKRERSIVGNSNIRIIKTTRWYQTTLKTNTEMAK